MNRLGDGGCLLRVPAAPPCERKSDRSASRGSTRRASTDPSRAARRDRCRSAARAVERGGGKEKGNPSRRGVLLKRGAGGGRALPHRQRSPGIRDVLFRA